ncbi:hypothetical protein P3T33_003619 [Rhizobium sp. AN67]|nr:hypothetical protein [Rhizobium sp. AN67]
MSCKERVLAIESYRPDSSFDVVVVDLNVAVGQEDLQADPIFGAVGQRLAEWGLGRDKGGVMDEPGMHVGDKRR